MRNLCQEDQYFVDLAEAVVNMEEEKAVLLAEKIVQERMNILQAIEYGLIQGMARVGELYETGEYFIPDLLVCSDVMNRAMDILEKQLPKEEHFYKGRAVIGTIQGDTHDIGKNIVAMLIRSGGYLVCDLGRDVPPERFVEGAVEYQADVIVISTLLTSTMQNMGKVIELLEEKKLRSRFYVMIGGKPVSQSFAESIGADYYTENAMEALRLMDKIFRQKQKEPAR